MNQNEIDKKRAELEAELAKLEDAEQLLASLSPEQRLAEALHDLQCHHNHTDMCDWYYDKWPNTRGQYSARATYLRKAEKVRTLLPSFTDEQIIEVAGALKA